MNDDDDLRAELRRIADGEDAGHVGPIDDPEAAARELTELLGLNSVGLAVTGGRIVGGGSSASADLYLSDGSVITFDSVRDFGTPKTLMLEVAVCTGARAKLNAERTYQAVVLLRALAERRETWTEDDISRDWGLEYLQSAKALDVDMRDQADRWRAFSALEAANPSADAREEGVPLVRAQIALVDANGARLIRCGWFLAFVREQTYISPKELSHRMERVGWVRRGNRGAIKATAPGRRARSLIWTFYIVPSGWGEVDDGDS